MVFSTSKQEEVSIRTLASWIWIWQECAEELRFGRRGKNPYPGSPKTKLCPLVVGNPKDHSLFGLGLPGLRFPEFDHSFSTLLAAQEIFCFLLRGVRVLKRF